MEEYLKRQKEFVEEQRKEIQQREHGLQIIARVEAREKFSENGEIIFKDIIEKKLKDGVIITRDWIVKHIKGIGYKEAGHFLRNIGFGEEVAILDRHILKNLKRFEVIEEIPPSITPKIYHEIEEKMVAFSAKINIPMDHLDFLFWYNEAGEVFK